VGRTPPAADAAKQQLQLISAIASALSPEDYDLRQERLEHVWQVNLLGDPMLQLSYPTQLALEAPAEARPGDTILIRGAAGNPGKLTLELALRRDQVPRELDRQSPDPNTLAGRELLQQRYQTANKRVLVCRDGRCSPGSFEQELEIPDHLPNGRYCIRAFVESEDVWQVGYHEISVRSPRP
jgi:hypothetical protein